MRATASGHRPATKSFADCHLEVMHNCLEAGHLGLLDHILAGPRTAHLLKYAHDEQLGQVEALRHKLVAQREIEAANGGPGSLIDPEHRFTKIIEEHRRPLVPLDQRL